MKTPFHLSASSYRNRRKRPSPTKCGQLFKDHWGGILEVTYLYQLMIPCPGPEELVGEVSKDVLDSERNSIRRLSGLWQVSPPFSPPPLPSPLVPSPTVDILWVIRAT